MRLTRKPMVFGLSAMALVAIGLAAFFGLWAFNGGASGENALVKTNVEWKVFDSQGILKSQGAGHNFTADNILNSARDRLRTAATQTQTVDTYTGIALCNTTLSGLTANGGTPTGGCVISANLDSNPIVGSTINSPSTGVYTVNKTFTASNTSTINELQLVKNPVTTVSPIGAAIGAAKTVTIVLAATDTLQVTWTITIS